jgi:CrcB protein
VDRRRDIWNELPVDPDLVESQPSGRADPRVLAAVALGAMPGALARYGLSQLVPATPGSFPWATFWTNISGSLALGLLLVVLIQRFPLDRHARAFAGTGFLGAYTTFSTFGVETDLLIKDGHAATAAAYVIASLAAGIGAAWLGVGLGRIAAGGMERRA